MFAGRGQLLLESATSLHSRPFSARNRSTCARSRAFSASNSALHCITEKSFSSSLAIRWAGRSCSQSHVGSRSFVRQEDTHPWPPDQDQLPVRQTQKSWQILAGGLTRQNPLFKTMNGGRLPWGFSRHDECTNPGNNHFQGRRGCHVGPVSGRGSGWGGVLRFRGRRLSCRERCGVRLGLFRRASRRGQSRPGMHSPRGGLHPKRLLLRGMLGWRTRVPGSELQSIRGVAVWAVPVFS